MLDKVRAYIIEKDILKYKDKIIIGLSGGADSVCLLRVLCELRKEFDLSLYAVHVNHKIRGIQADADEEYSKKLAKAFGVECKCVSYAVPELAIKWKMSEEEAGRKIRYDVFEQERSWHHAEKIAVAHHQNDQVETVLFRMCRGTGIKGMIGIPVSRDKIIRPLLCVSKSEIYDYLKSINQDYREDETNNCIDYDRNRIRNNVIPELERVNEHAVNHISDMSEQLALVYDWLVSERKTCYDNYVTWDDSSYSIGVENLKGLHPALAGEIIRVMISKLTDSLKDIEMRHISYVLELADKESGKKIDLPYELVAEKEYEKIRLYKNMSEKIQNEQNVLIKNGSDYFFDDVYLPDQSLMCGHLRLECITLNEVVAKLNIPKNSCTKWIDCDKIKNTLSVRRPRNDDYIVISNNCTKRLTRYFIDDKIPRQYRDRLLVIADGNHVVWVVGGRTSQGCYVDDNTTAVVQISINQQ